MYVPWASRLYPFKVFSCTRPQAASENYVPNESNSSCIYAFLPTTQTGCSACLQQRCRIPYFMYFYLHRFCRPIIIHSSNLIYGVRPPTSTNCSVRGLGVCDEVLSPLDYPHTTAHTHDEWLDMQRGFSASTRTHTGFTVPPNHSRTAHRIQPCSTSTPTTNTSPLCSSPRGRP